VPRPWDIAESTRRGPYLRDLFKLNSAAKNAAGGEPDETPPTSCDPLFLSYSAHLGRGVIADDSHSPPKTSDGMLSEHQGQAGLEGCLLTAHGLFNCYKAFIHIVDSMCNHTPSGSEACRRFPGAAVSALNTCVIACLAPGSQRFSHQEFRICIESACNKHADVVRVYLPPVTKHIVVCCRPVALRSRYLVNVITP